MVAVSDELLQPTSILHLVYNMTVLFGSPCWCFPFMSWRCILQAADLHSVFFRF